MTNKKVAHNPHDRFFKEAMSHKRTAKEFFETYIPKNTLDKIDLESIKHEKESFIYKDLGDGVVDALFSVSLTNGEPGYLYVLLEHQTDQEHFMAFRFWKYILRIIERHIKQHPKEKMLPYVLPIVLYTGTAVYRVAHSFFDLFYDPEFAKELLTGEFKVVELNNVSDHELKKRLYSGVMQLMLKNIRLPDILPFLEGISGLIQMLGEESFIYIKNVIWYTLERGESGKSKEVIELFSKLFEDRKEEVMTITDQLREQNHYAKRIIVEEKETLAREKRTCEQPANNIVCEKTLTVSCIDTEECERGGIVAGSLASNIYMHVNYPNISLGTTAKIQASGRCEILDRTVSFHLKI